MELSGSFDMEMVYPYCGSTVFESNVNLPIKLRRTIIRVDCSTCADDAVILARGDCNY